jgi:hypothetical protein
MDSRRGIIHLPDQEDRTQCARRAKQKKPKVAQVRAGAGVVNRVDQRAKQATNGG